MLTYDEIRSWATELGVFTASDLADKMGVPIDVARRAVTALVYHGICDDTGDIADGVHGYEAVIAYVPPPDTAPTTRQPSGPSPEHLAMRDIPRIVVPRGAPIRIRTERDMRKSLSTPGARQHHKNREREYLKQQAAVARRATEQAIKAKLAQPKTAGTKTAARAKKKANKKK